MPAKRRRRFQGLYYHSSPPKVLPMNGQITNDNGRKRRDNDVKLSTIRIWMHEKDIGKLTRILWAGQGQRLRQQASTNSKVKRFLTAVPYVMNSVKDVHQAVIDNSLETLQTNLEPPVPPALVTCRDANGLNLIHKAAGLGHATILEYLITTWPDGVHETDITGKTPLHWAASAKNNMRCYTLLTQAGCDEEAVDYKMKTPSFYRHKPHDIERAFLTYVPEAPRVSPDVSTDWEALSDESGDGKKLDIKIPEMNGFGRHSNAESNENSSEAEMAEGTSGLEDEDMPKEDDGEEHETEDVTENEQEKEEDTPELENTEDNEKEEEEGEPKQVEPEMDQEKQEKQEEDKPQGTTEEEEEAPAEKEAPAEEDAPDEEEAPDEENKDKEGEPQDDKQQTATLNNTTTTTPTRTEETEAEHESKSNGEKSKEESNTEQEEKSPDNDVGRKDTENENKEENIKEYGEMIEDSKETKDNEDIKDKADKDKGKEGDEKEEVKEELKENKDNEDIEDKSSKEEEKEEGEKEEMKEELEKNKDSKGIEDKIDKKEEIKEELKENIDNEDIKDISSKEEDGKKEEMKEELKENNDNKDIEDKTDKEEEEKEEGEKEEIVSKTVGETLEVIKEELKDNVKYLANKVKNVFSHNENETNETVNKGDGKEENHSEETSNEKESDAAKENENGNEEKTNAKESAADRKENNANDEKNSIIKEQAIKKEETEDIENNKESIIKKNEEKNSLNEDKEKTEKIDETEIINTVLTINDDNSNNIKDHHKNHINSLTKETQLKDSAKNEINKTKEDENNNHAKEIENVKEPTDEDFDKINKSLQEYVEGKEASVEETQKGIGDKLEEIADNVKESLKETQLEIGDKLEEISNNAKDNVKDMASKVKNIFTTSSEEDKNKLENESLDVVVLTESPTKQPKKPNKKESESSDEEDEATQSVEAKTMKSNGGPANETIADSDQENTANDEREVEGSPTSSLAIEGFVQGEAEDNTVQSQIAAYVDDDEDTRLQNILASGDMEQLAQIVLNGDGQKLLDVEATEPEIQAFLKNVPNYMSKIRRVHEASRSGSLLNLQQALDRRKFAIAKDKISPNGATPLHVAVLFGHSDIVRYLSARFPETTTITDADDRTALHYAAVINDNGHFYNVLLQLGANPKELDKMGHSPEEYFTNESLKDTLSYGQLLKSFGAEDLEAQLLSDQGHIENHSYQENPIFKTEQGKYLVDNLADPLIKALTQVAQKRPNDPLEYLTNYLNTCVTSRNTNGKTKTQAAIHSGSSQTNSMALINAKSSTPPVAQIMAQRQTAPMNGHVKYGNTDEIAEDSLPQIDATDYDDDDDDNDSDAALSKKLDERDEHGQSMLHFACARSHRKGGLIHLIEEAKADISYRDELYRTARDVALQANQLGNAKEIDRYLISLVIVGDLKPFEHFAISGYDHIIDVVDDNEMPVIEIAESKGHMELAQYLRTIRPLEELREELHQMIRDNNVNRVMEIANGSNGRWFIKAKNYYGRTALHIAILKESEEIIEHFVNLCPEALTIGDNLERTALHYAMGTNIIESISRVLIQNGAKRTYKDLKGRQPSYYFMNKADILRLQEEEDENR